MHMPRQKKTLIPKRRRYYFPVCVSVHVSMSGICNEFGWSVVAVAMTQSQNRCISYNRFALHQNRWVGCWVSRTPLKRALWGVIAQLGASNEEGSRRTDPPSRVFVLSTWALAPG